MTMLSTAGSYLEKLFGSTVDADCVIRFTLASDAHVRRAKKPRIESAPSPALDIRRGVAHTTKDATSLPAIQNQPSACPCSGAGASNSEVQASKRSPETAPVNTGGKGNSSRRDGNDSDVVEVDPGAALFIGDPIPAHRLVLRCSSERFRAYMERWEQQPPPLLSSPPRAKTRSEPEPPCSQDLAPLDSQPQNNVADSVPDHTPIKTNTSSPAAGGNNANGDAGAGQDPTNTATATPGSSNTAAAGTSSPAAAGAAVPAAPVKRKRPRTAAASAGCDDLPEILIPLDSEEELPAARRALRFMYSGSVPPSLGFKDILNTRRMAAYLQVERCAEGCDEAMIAKLKAECGMDTAVVLDAYACWHAFAEERSFIKVLLACQTHLIKHFPDALSILNSDPDRPAGRYRQFVSLPPPAVEALLASSFFGTDTESSVLLLLGFWLKANPFRPPGLRSRFCRLIRVTQLSPAYLTHVLPQLDWFDATPAQRAILTAYGLASSPTERANLTLSVSATGLKLEPPETVPTWGFPAVSSSAVAGSDWMAGPRVRCRQPKGVQCFSWRVSWEEMERVARAAAAEPDAPRGTCWRCEVTFKIKQVPGARGAAAAAEGADDLRVVFAHGLRWKLSLVMPHCDAPYVQLSCRVPLNDFNFAGTHDMAKCPVHVMMRRSPTAAAEAADEDRLRDGIIIETDGTAPFGVGNRLNFLSFERRVGHMAAVHADAAAVQDQPQAQQEQQRQRRMLGPWESFLQEDRTVQGELFFAPPPPPTRLRRHGLLPLGGAAAGGAAGAGGPGGGVRGGHRRPHVMVHLHNHHQHQHVEEPEEDPDLQEEEEEEDMVGVEDLDFGMEDEEELEDVFRL